MARASSCRISIHLSLARSKPVFMLPPCVLFGIALWLCFRDFSQQGRPVNIGLPYSRMSV